MSGLEALWWAESYLFAINAGRFLPIICFVFDELSPTSANSTFDTRGDEDGCTFLNGKMKEVSLNERPKIQCLYRC
jgi:hypothetical protein